MITNAIAQQLRLQSLALLEELEAPAIWLTEAIDTFNARVVNAADQQSVEGNPLLIRLLLDHLHTESIGASAITWLVKYYKCLPEYNYRSWRARRAAILDDNFSAFHSALTELSLHSALATLSNLTVRFIEPEPGGRQRPDYELNFRSASLEAELKSIISEQIRSPFGTRFVGHSVNAKTARAVWRKFTQPHREGQLDPSKASVVFVDISLCDDLYAFLGLARDFSKSGLDKQAQMLLRDLWAARTSKTECNAGFFVCGFDPASFGLLFLSPVTDPGQRPK